MLHEFTTYNSMLNHELEKRILGIAKRICGPNCKNCKSSLVQNLQNRSRLFNYKNKRTVDSTSNLDSYHDVQEFSPESLPNKYRKHSLNHGRTSRLLKDSTVLSNLESEGSHTDSNKRKIIDISSSDAELILESIKKRIIERNESPPPQKKEDEDPEREKLLEEQYKEFVNKVDLATVTELLRYDSKLDNEEKPSSDYVKDKPEAVNIFTIHEVTQTTRELTGSQTLANSQKDVTDTLVNKEFKPQEEPSSYIKSNKEDSSTTVLGFGTLDKKNDLFKKTEETKVIGIGESGLENKSKLNLFDTTSTAKNLFTTESKEDKNPFDILHKINAPIPQGNPLFAPKQPDLSTFKPKTNGSNFVFGQSSSFDTQAATSVGTNIFGNTQTQQLPQTQLTAPQFVIPGFGNTAIQQPNGSNPFGGQFFRSKRGRGRGRGR